MASLYSKSALINAYIHILIYYNTILKLKERNIVPGLFVLSRKTPESVPGGTVRVADAERADKTGTR